MAGIVARRGSPRGSPGCSGRHRGRSGPRAARGPSGWPSPRRAAASMSAAVATPSSSSRIASASSGKRARLTMKPGRSALDRGVFAIDTTSAWTSSRVASLVSGPRMTSTRGIAGTGLKKCIPMTRERRSAATAVASVAMDNELVFEARTVSCGASRSSSANRSHLVASSSMTASMTMSMPTTPAARSGAIDTRDRAADPPAPEVSRPDATSRSRSGRDAGQTDLRASTLGLEQAHLMTGQQPGSGRCRGPSGRHRRRGRSVAPRREGTPGAGSYRKNGGLVRM